MMRVINHILIFCLLLAMHFAQAQGSVSFESEGPSKEVPEGSRFEVSFSLKNTFANRFIPPTFNGFRVTGGPSEMRGSGFVNGKSYSHQTWTYELEAGEPGSYTIGSATAQTDSRTLRTQPLVIRVGKARPNRAVPPAGSDANLFVSAELDRESVWVGQQVLYQIKLYTQVSISDYDILDLPDFDGFFSRERQRFDTRTQYQKIKGKRYAVRILHEMALFPQRAGELRIGPAQVRLGVDQGGGLPSFFSSKPELVRTQAVKLKVEPLPEPAPEHFSGAVGQYKWQVSTDRDSLSTDDALTLRIVIEGNGDARRFANPVLDLPDGLEGFDPKIVEQEEYETGEQFVHARTLEYVILPREPGDYSFMPELVVFDPDSNQYRRLLADSTIHLHVIKGQYYGRQTPPIDSIADRPEPAVQSPLTGLWLSAKNWLLSPVLWSIVAGLVILVFMLVWWRRRSQRVVEKLTTPDESLPKADLKLLRRKMKAVGEHIQTNNSRLFYHDLLKVLQEHTALYAGIEPVLLTKEDMRTKLLERQAPPAVIDTLVQIWEKCEQSVYAGQDVSANMHAVWQQADSALQNLDSALK